MISRIAKYGLVIVLALALVGGTAYILLRPVEARGGQGNGSLDSNQAGNGYRGGQQTGETRGTGGVPGGPGSGRLEGSTGAGYRGGQGGANGRQDVARLAEEADHPADTWLTLTGEVVTLDHELIIRTGDDELEIEPGPEWYLEGLGVQFAPGDQVAVSGFYEEDEFKATVIENQTAGQTALLRDEMGHPLWAGRGRGKE